MWQQQVAGQLQELREKLDGFLLQVGEGEAAAPPQCPRPAGLWPAAPAWPWTPRFRLRIFQTSAACTRMTRT